MKTIRATVTDFEDKFNYRDIDSNPTYEYTSSYNNICRPDSILIYSLEKNDKYPESVFM